MGKFDEFFDDVVVNTKAAAVAVTKKAAELYDTSKHKISAAEIRGEINKKLKDLGAITYRATVHNIDLSEQIAELVAEISELKDNLNIINGHIDAAKNQKRCPNCDAGVPKNSLFCNICGAKLEDETEEDAEAEKIVEEEKEAPVDNAEGENVFDVDIDDAEDTDDLEDSDETVGI